MNLQIFRLSKILANQKKSLSDELNQQTSFTTARLNKKIRLFKKRFFCTVLKFEVLS